MTPGALADLNGRWWDWRVEHWDATELTLIADNDLTYHHAVTVTFAEAAYVACPRDFSHPSFREAAVEELDRVRQAVDGDLGGLAVFAWDLADVDGPAKVCLVAALSARVDEGLILH